MFFSIEGDQLDVVLPCNHTVIFLELRLIASTVLNRAFWFLAIRSSGVFRGEDLLCRANGFDRHR